MPRPPKERTWDTATKEKYVEKILRATDKRSAYDSIRKEIGIQSYQLYSWIGQYLVEKDVSTHDGPEATTNNADIAIRMLTGKLSDEEQKNIALAVVKQFIT